jgi:hypothetical protein
MGDATPIDNVTGAEVLDPNKDPSDINPETEVSETPETETEEVAAEAEVETPQVEDKPETTVKAEDIESFTSSVDPSKLPQELQGVYKQMQADYTRKTQEVAGLRRSAEAYQRFQPYLQKIFADQNLTNLVFKGQQPQPDKPAEEEVLPDDPKEYAEYIKKQAREEIMQEIEQRERQRQFVEADAQDRSQAETVDPRLNADPAFAEKIAALVNANPAYQQRRVTAVEATKQAVKDFDSYVKSLAMKMNQDLVNRAKNSSSGVASKTSPGTTRIPDKAMTIHEAWLEAEAELANTK